MSFYHKLLQHFLTQHFTDVNNESEKKNNGYITGLLRDKELSKEKQASGHDATLELHDWSWEKVQNHFSDKQAWSSVDECIKDVFDSVIDNYQRSVDEKVRKADANSGDTIPAVLAGKELLELIWKQCDEYDLLDVEYDENDPGDIFMHTMLLYVCDRIKIKEALTFDKVKLTKGMLKKTTNYFLKNDAMSQKEKIDYVQGEIQALINSNKVACVESAEQKTSIPATIPGNILTSAASNLFKLKVTTSIGSSEGSLGKLLNQALERINRLSLDRVDNRRRRACRSARAENSNDRNRHGQNIERDGLTLQNWIDRYQKAQTQDEKEDIFFGAINLDNNDDLFKFAPLSIKNNRDYVSEAAVINVKTLKYASNKLKANKTFMLDLMQEVPEAQYYASERLKRDPDFQRAAVSPFVSMMFKYQHFWGSALIGLAVAAITIAITFTTSLALPAMIGITAGAGLVASTISFFALRPAQVQPSISYEETDDMSFVV